MSSAADRTGARGDGPAIVVDSVTKRFRRWRAVHPHTGLKTALVEWFRGLAGGGPGARAADRVDVLRDVSFVVRRGETVGLIGRNGAGKSTLLRVIAGIYRPDAGRVSVEGRVAALIELGGGFHPDFTGRENVVVNGIILGLPRREILARLPAIAEFAEIGEALDAPVRTYSSGMFLRLAFSVAVHVDPDVLLVDEILGVGDEAFQEKSRRAIEARIGSGDRTTVIVSHDLDAVTRLCGRVVWIDPPHAHVFANPAEGVGAFRAALAASRVPDAGIAAAPVGGGAGGAQ